MLRLLLVLVAFVASASLAEPGESPKPEAWIAAWEKLPRELTFAAIKVDRRHAELTDDKDDRPGYRRTPDQIAAVLLRNREAILELQRLILSGASLPDHAGISEDDSPRHWVRQTTRILLADAHRLWTNKDPDTAAERLSACMRLASLACEHDEDLMIMTGSAVADAALGSMEALLSAESDTPFTIDGVQSNLDEVQRWEGEPFDRFEEVFRRNATAHLYGPLRDLNRQDEIIGEDLAQIARVKELLREIIDADG